MVSYGCHPYGQLTQYEKPNDPLRPCQHHRPDDCSPGEAGRAAGFTIDEVVADDGVSGLNTRLADRPRARRLLDMLRRGDVLVVRWIDRLGCNYADVCDTVREFMKRSVVIQTVINGMAFDGATTDPMQQAVRDAPIAFMAASAQAQAEATKETQRAGIDHAKSREDAYRGRKPSFTRDQLQQVLDMLGQEAGPSAISVATGLSRRTVHRIRADQVAAQSMLARWGALA
jgi:putative DNA-invertase from lambdoid prophage Rac